MVPTDPSLNDQALQQEIALLADLMLAATSARAPLTEDQLDSALGLIDDRPSTSDNADTARRPGS